MGVTFGGIQIPRLGPKASLGMTVFKDEGSRMKDEISVGLCIKCLMLGIGTETAYVKGSLFTVYCSLDQYDSGAFSSSLYPIPLTLTIRSASGPSFSLKWRI